MNDRLQRARYLLAKNLLWAGKPNQAIDIGVPLLASRTQARAAADSMATLLTQLVAQAHVCTDRLRQAEAVYLPVIKARRVATLGTNHLQAELSDILLQQGRTGEAETLTPHAGTPATLSSETRPRHREEIR